MFFTTKKRELAQTNQCKLVKMYRRMLVELIPLLPFKSVNKKSAKIVTYRLLKFPLYYHKYYPKLYKESAQYQQRIYNPSKNNKENKRNIIIIITIIYYQNKIMTIPLFWITLNKIVIWVSTPTSTSACSTAGHRN